MLRSMWSGVSGLRTHQTRMDVIGNDIANVNTVGFKQNDVSFKEQLVTTIRRPQVLTQGQQIGLGVQMGAISRDFADGVLTETGRSTNLAIAGDGFFQVQTQGGDNFYTRAGDFTFVMNAAGNLELQNSSGLSMTDGAGTIIQLDPTTTSFAIASDGTITTDVALVAGNNQLLLATFANNNGLASAGNNLFEQVDAASGIAQFAAPGVGGRGDLYQGYLENSNVNLANEFTEMIITQRGFQANSRSITTSDEMLNEILMLKR